MAVWFERIIVPEHADVGQCQGVDGQSILPTLVKGQGVRRQGVILLSECLPQFSVDNHPDKAIAAKITNKLWHVISDDNF